MILGLIIIILALTGFITGIFQNLLIFAITTPIQIIGSLIQSGLYIPATILGIIYLILKSR